MRVVGKDIFERIASPDDWIKISRSLNERTVGGLYSPLPKQVSESILARLATYDLSTLYAINTRLLNLIKAILNEAFRHGWPRTGPDLKTAIKSAKEDLSELTDISDYLCYEHLNSETILLQRIRKPTLKDFPFFGKLFVLQQVIQEHIESIPLGRSKAENFLQSYLDYPCADENSDEAIIYWLTRDEKSDHIKSFLDYYRNGNDTGMNSGMFNKKVRLKRFLNGRKSVLEKSVSDFKHDANDSIRAFINSKTNIIETPNSLRFLQKNTIKYLHTALLLPEEKTGVFVPGPSLFDFSRLFSLLKSELSVTLAYEDIGQLLFACHEFIDNFNDNGWFFDSYFNYSLCTLGIVSLFIFGCQRIKSNLIHEKPYDVAIGYITKWKEEVSRNHNNYDYDKDYLRVASASMAVHALFSIKSDISGNFTEQMRNWLLSKQYKYGYWHRENYGFLQNDNYLYEEADGEPLYTTVMVLDALELLSRKPNPTFDPKFVYVAGKKGKGRKKRGRPVTNTIERRQRTLKDYEKCRAVGNNSHTAWDMAAHDNGFPSGEAARKACEKLQKKVE